MNAVATIRIPNQYKNDYTLDIGCEDGQSVFFHFDTRKEATAMAKGLGIELLTNKNFSNEMYLRMHTIRTQHDIYYSYASNG